MPARERARRLAGRAAALALGVLPVLALPAPSWWWLAWVGLVPLLLAVCTAPTAREGGIRGWCGLTGYVLTAQYWLLPLGGPLWVVMAAGLGALWLPWGWAAHRLLSGADSARAVLVAMIVLPSAWVTAEVVRSWPSLGGPWAALGASQWNQPATLASASLGGVWLTSFLIAAVNTGVAGVLLHRGMPGRVVPFAAVLACAGLGPAWYAVGAAPHGGSTARVALVQPGVVDDATARAAASEELTAALADQRVDLVVWGESSMGLDPAGHPDVMRNLRELSRRVGADLLVNVDAPDPGGGIYKSSVLIGPDGMLGGYRKTRLVPFGEYVPLRPVLGWLTRHTKAAGEDRRRGTDQVVLHAGSLPIGPLISFEALFSDLPRHAGTTRCATARVSKFDVDIPGQLGTAPVGQRSRGTRRRSRPPGSAYRVVRRQRGIRRARAQDCVVPIGLPRHDRRQCSAGITHHRIPVAGRVGSGTGIVDPGGCRGRGYRAVAPLP